MTDVFKVLLEDNLIEEEDFETDPTKYTVLECFHFNLPVHPELSRFSAIRELRIIEQDVSDLEWLKDTPNVENLFVFHTQVSNSNGLSYVKNLKELCLEADKLTSIPNLLELKSLIRCSIAMNPISETPVFPALESLEELNIADIGLTTIDKSLLNLKHLKVLNLGGNHLSDFEFINILSKADELEELSLNDARFGQNPVCCLPNYDTIMISELPKISVLDQFTIPGKFRKVCTERKKEVEFYYQSLAESELATLAEDNKRFLSELNALFSKIGKSFSDYSAAVSIDSLVCDFQNAQRDLETMIRTSYQWLIESGGNVSLTRCDDWKDLSFPAENYSDGWKVNVEVVSMIHRGETPDNFVAIGVETLSEALDVIKDWNLQYENRADIEEKVSSPVVIVCEIFGDDSNPVYILRSADSPEQILEQIQSLCTYKDYESISDQFNLVSVSKSFTLTSTLRSIHLEKCGIESLSIFAETPNVEELRVPFNDIRTLNDLPTLQSLKVLDVSFNQIRELSELTPENTESIECITLIGNPVYGFICLKVLRSLLPNYRTSIPVLFDLKDTNFDDSLLSVDISGNCLQSLEPLNQLIHLKRLNASNNCLRRVDFKSANLTYADFSNNCLIEFPNSDDFPTMETLIMNCNLVTRVVSFPSLITLFVGSNKIDAIPHESLLPKLRVLYISDNPIMSEITDLRCLFQFPKLKMLNGQRMTPQIHAKAKSAFQGILFAEDLSRIVARGQTTLDLSDEGYRDVNLLQSESLQSLVLANNNLSVISWAPNAFPKLVNLSLANNQIQSFEFLRELRQLRSLNLSANKLNDNNMIEFCRLKFPHLQVLILSHNSFKTCASFQAANFPALESLDLSHNFLSVIGSGALDCLKLKELCISYNSLRKAENLGIQSLISLDISHNRITAVEEVYHLVRCAKLTKFWFNDNPLAQRTSPRIRCLTILRTLKEMDGRAVTESDIAQVRILLDQGTGIALSPSTQQTTSSRTLKVSNIVVSPPLPALQPQNPPLISKRGRRR